VVLRAAKSVKGIAVRPEVVDEARTACRELRLIGKSRRRERRPTPEELAKLDEYFGRRDGRARVPMQDIMWFAIHAGRCFSLKYSQCCDFYLSCADLDGAAEKGFAGEHVQEQIYTSLPPSAGTPPAHAVTACRRDAAEPMYAPLLAAALTTSQGRHQSCQHHA
jgi:hypothetical protein